MLEVFPLRPSEIPCKCVSIENGRENYYILIDKTKLTSKDSGSYEIPIQLSDDQSIYINDYKLKISIEVEGELAAT